MKNAITSTQEVLLDAKLRAYVDSFDFTNDHRATPVHTARFGGGLPTRPASEKPPQEVAATESRYVTQLFGAYSEHTGTRIGYDLVLLGLETLDGKSFTLWRSIDGGGFRLYEDLHQTPPTNEIPYTQLLSFRNIARLMIVDETEITQQSSPLIDGNPTANTPNLATFKLLLTGADDSAYAVLSD